jgi:peptidoglycan lytic transglycosylase G
MKKSLSLIIVILLVILAGWVFKIMFISQSGTGDIKTFIIEPGQGVNQISKNLNNEDLLDSSLVFETLLWLKKSESKIQAGEHKLQDIMSINSLINSLISGVSVANEREIKFLEGWNLRDVGFYLENEGIVQAEELWELVGFPGVDHDIAEGMSRPKDYTADYEFLKEKPKNISYEGFLFPDTYRVFKDATVEDIVIKMLNNFDKKITSKMLGDIQNQDKKLYEILILASIIEKEGDTPENKKKVAGVYNNRLELGMALQADPTVNYITGKVTDRPSLDDIDTDNLYNTYKYPGLPPGPICNPGIDSIMAAIYPDSNGYYFFINTPDGEMIFSRDFEEHKRNRIKYFKN